MSSQYDSFDDEEDEGGGSLDPEVLKSYLAFGVRAVRQRWLLVSGLFVGLSALVLGLLAIWPRTYHCETRLSRGSTGALSSGEDRGGFEGAATSVMAFDNLKTIVEQTDLAKHWPETRSPLHRMKDALLGGGTLTDQNAAELLVAVLQQRLSVTVSWDGLLVIAAEWPTPEMAARLVETARENYLETRHVSEISTLAENISILEGHVAKARSEVFDIAANAKALREEKQTKAEAALEKTSKAAPKPVRVVRTGPPPVDDALAGMKTVLEAKQKAILDLEAERGRRVRELQGKLRELQLTYTEVHPEVVHVKMNLSSLETESPQVTALRAEVADLTKEIERRESLVAGSASGSAAAPRRVSAGAAAPPKESTSLPPEMLALMRDSEGEVDPTVAAQFELAVQRYSELQRNIASLRVEMDRAQAAFKRRYKIVTPAEVPNAPIKPKTKLIAPAGIGGALFFALLMALGLELRAGRIVARWQVQRLQLPILAEVKLPPGPSS